jgi:hypothetical protein
MFTTYDWEPKKPQPQPHLGLEHECVKFKTLDSWVKSRSFDIKQANIFIHPNLGEPFSFRYHHPIDDWFFSLTGATFSIFIQFQLIEKQ